MESVLHISIFEEIVDPATWLEPIVTIWAPSLPPWTVWGVLALLFAGIALYFAYWKARECRLLRAAKRYQRAQDIPEPPARPEEARGGTGHGGASPAASVDSVGTPQDTTGPADEGATASDTVAAGGSAQSIASSRRRQGAGAPG